jgi:hypothetical protein
MNMSPTAPASGRWIMCTLGLDVFYAAACNTTRRRMLHVLQQSVPAAESRSYAISPSKTNAPACGTAV